MVVSTVTDFVLFGVHADTKPLAGIATNTLFFEIDTGDIYKFTGGVWSLFSGRAKQETLTNKTLTFPIISSISNAGTLTLPTGNRTIVARDTTDTLTNKTLTLPTISTISNGGVITLPTGTRTLVARDTADTLLSKTISVNANTVTATSQATGDILVNNGTQFVRLARGTTGQLLQATATTLQWATVGSSSISTSNFDYTYLIYKSGTTYFAQTGNGPTAALTSNASFATLFNSIISAISPAGTATYIRIAPGDYDLAAQISIPTTAKGNIVIEGAGIGLTNINITSAWNSIALGTQAIKIGSLPTITAGITGTLTANCAIRTNTCTVSTTDAAKFAVGDYVLLTSTLAWSTAPSAGSPQTEMKKLTAVNTGTGVITFDVPTFDTYNTANTAVIYRLSGMLSNVRLSGLTVRKGSGLTTDTGNTTGVVYLTASCVDNLQVDNCQFIDPVTNFDACLNLKSCVNSEVSNSSFIMTPGNTYNLQYGVAIGTCCQNVQVSNSRAFGRFRHSFEGANDSSSSGWQGIARNITFANCVVEGAEVGAFDTHVGGEMISFVNCKVLGTTISTGNVGFEIRARKTQLIGCSVEGASTYGFQFSGDAHDGIVSGCKARACLTEGLRLINDQAGVKRTVITGSTFIDNGNNGIRIDSGCDYTIITGNTVYNNLNNGMYLVGSDFLLINSNTVTNNGSSGIWVDPLALTLSNIQVTNNTTLNNASLQVKTTTSTSGGTVSATSVNNVINWNTGFTTNIQQYNQIINATNNTITDTSTAAGDILKSNGTKFVRLGRGTANQVLQTNSGATDLAWASFNSEITGTAQASGTGSATVFNIPHTLGSTPYSCFVQCYSHSTAFTYAFDATNITVTFVTAPPSGTNNVKFTWRALL